MQLCEVTWPPARRFDQGVFTLRDGAGGGKRVSAATWKGGDIPGEREIRHAEARMEGLAQKSLFQIREGDSGLDICLADAGYRIVDPVNLYVIDTQKLTSIPIPRLTTFDIWEPLSIMVDLWAAAGIGPERMAVMHRATCPKTAIFGRVENSPAGVAFVGLSEGIAMVHALEVRPDKRRKGLAHWMMRRAALWAMQRNAAWLSVICTRENAAANALYRRLGFEHAGGYHYRIKG